MASRYPVVWDGPCPPTGIFLPRMPLLRIFQAGRGPDRYKEWKLAPRRKVLKPGSRRKRTQRISIDAAVARIYGPFHEVSTRGFLSSFCGVAADERLRVRRWCGAG